MAADATVAHATEGSHHHCAGNSHCQNCGAPLRGPFCHRCGQHDFDVNRSFRHTFLEALESFFHFDTKLFRNLLTLLFRPGRLTAAFNAGKRSSQMPPFRLYVFVSIFFFFSASLIGNNGRPSHSPMATARAEIQETAPSENSHATGPVQAAISDEELSSVEEALGSTFREKLQFFATSAGQKAMNRSFLSALPKLILLCLPFFALYTRFLFRKSKQVYLQHLVLALHFHTFIYLWLMFEKGWELVFGLVSPTAAGWIDQAGKIWMVLYPLLMLHYVFANPWWKSLLKTFVLSLAYAFTLIFGFLVTVAILLLNL